MSELGFRVFPDSQEKKLQKDTPEIKKTLYRCKVLIIKVENIGIEPMTF